VNVRNQSSAALQVADISWSGLGQGETALLSQPHPTNRPVPHHRLPRNRVL